MGILMGMAIRTEERLAEAMDTNPFGASTRDMLLLLESALMNLTEQSPSADVARAESLARSVIQRLDPDGIHIPGEIVREFAGRAIRGTDALESDDNVVRVLGDARADAMLAALHSARRAVDMHAAQLYERDLLDLAPAGDAPDRSAATPEEAAKRARGASEEAHRTEGGLRRAHPGSGLSRK